MDYGTPHRRLPHSHHHLRAAAILLLPLLALPSTHASTQYAAAAIALQTTSSSSACCVIDITGTGPKRCSELTAVPSMAGGNGRDVSPSRLLRCVNDANRTRSGRPNPWSEEIAHIQAVGSWWSTRPSVSPVTVVTQLSIGRLPQLWAQCLSWRGPLSAAVYIPKPEGATVVTKKQLWCSMHQAYALYKLALSEPLACNLDIILLYEQRSGHGSMKEYPVNVLRNVARLQARTATVAMIDVDMLMSREMMHWLRAPANLQALEAQCRARSVYVLPAFEVLGNNTNEAAAMADQYSSTDKASLMSGVANGTLSSFAAVRYARGHYATNFARWATSREPYVVPYASGFEPWVLTHRKMAPWHDARFRGYGLNKISHIAHLNASGYKFIVHPSAFIIHRAHNTSSARKRFNSDMVNYYLAHKHQDLANGTVYKRHSEHKQMNSYFKVNHMFVVMKQEMDQGVYTTVLDGVTKRCRKSLPWWLASTTAAKKMQKAKLV